jgi:hypothetical protein
MHGIRVSLGVGCLQGLLVCIYLSLKALLLIDYKRQPMTVSSPPILLPTACKTVDKIEQVSLTIEACSTSCHHKSKSSPRTQTPKDTGLRSTTPIPILKASSHNQCRQQYHSIIRATGETRKSLASLTWWPTYLSIPQISPGYDSLTSLANSIGPHPDQQSHTSVLLKTEQFCEHRGRMFGWLVFDIGRWADKGLGDWWLTTWQPIRNLNPVEIHNINQSSDNTNISTSNDL